MAINKAKKSEILEKLSGIAGGEGLRVFVNFHGLTVADTTNLRKALRAAGVTYFVAKKTLLKKAFGEKKIGGALPELPGEIAVAYGEDPMASAREVYKLQKTLKDKLKIVGGVFENAFVDATHMMAIATVPPREVLLSQFLNVINSPIQRFAVAIDQISKSR